MLVHKTLNKPTLYPLLICCIFGCDNTSQNITEPDTGVSQETDTSFVENDGDEASPWMWVSANGDVNVEAEDGDAARAVGLTAQIVEAPTPAQGYEFISPVVELVPHGARFDAPVRIELTHSDNTSTNLVVLRLASPEQRQWERIQNPVFTASTATVETYQLSYYGVARPKNDEECDETNACGGCEALENEPDELCGPCNQDRYVCDDDDTDQTVCNGSTTNVCGGCEILENQPDETCGPCNQDRYMCDGTSLICNGSTTNVCGGCDTLENEPDEACGPCGQDRYICDEGDTNQTVCNGSTANTCGGCDVLDNQPDEPCGPCSQDRYVCDGTSLICNGATINTCGGCEALENEPDEACGPCGQDRYVCDEDDINQTVCNGSTANVCGGCERLENAPDETCGPCNQDRYVCDGTSLICNGSTTNACGGCDTLENEPDEPCGPCSQDRYVCDGDDANQMVCSGSTINACGGCEILENEPDDTCGPCGLDHYVCDGTSLVCGSLEVCDGCQHGDSCQDGGVWNCDGNGMSCLPTECSAHFIHLGGGTGVENFAFAPEDYEGRDHFRATWTPTTPDLYRINVLDGDYFPPLPGTRLEVLRFDPNKDSCEGDMLAFVDSYQEWIDPNVCPQPPQHFQSPLGHLSTLLHAQAGQTFLIKYYFPEQLAGDFNMALMFERLRPSDRLVHAYPGNGHISRHDGIDNFVETYKVGDLNGDGRDDLLLDNTVFRISDSVATFTVYYGQNPEESGQLFTEAEHHYTLELPQSVPGPNVLPVGDRTGNGRDDLVFRSLDQGYFLLRNPPDGDILSVSDVPQHAVALSNALGINSGDLDGDSFDDMLVHTEDGELRVVFGPLTAESNPDNAQAFIAGEWLAWFHSDWNRDQHSDIAVTSAQGAYIFAALERLSYATEDALWSVDAPGMVARQTGDLNGDTIEDIMLCDPSNTQCSLFFGPLVGRTTLADADVSLQAQPGTFIQILGDVTGDQIVDLAVMYNNSTPQNPILLDVIEGPVLNNAMLGEPTRGRFWNCVDWIYQPFSNVNTVRGRAHGFVDFNGDGIHDLTLWFLGGGSAATHLGGPHFPTP